MASDSPEPSTQDSTGRWLRNLFWPHRVAIATALGLGIGGVVPIVIGPKLLGYATDLIVAGYIGQHLPGGQTKAETIAQLRVQGRDHLANVYSTIDLRPGYGIDVGRLGWVLALVLALYAAASLLTFLQGRLVATVVARVVLDLRERVQAKLARLPLSYFDRSPRGELLSRITNDIDNVQLMLQQGLGQLITSLFTIVGVLVLMLVISPLLTLIVLLSVPAVGFLVHRVTSRAQPHFTEQWAQTETLTGHIEEMYTGHALITGFDRRDLAEATFDEHNEAMTVAGTRAQSISGTIGPAMMFVASFNFVAVAVVGALRVATGGVSIGGVQAFIQYAGQFSYPLVEVANIAGQVQSGLVSAGRVIALLEADEQRPDPVAPARPVGSLGRVEFEAVSFRYDPAAPLIERLSLTVEAGQTVAIVGQTGAGKTTVGNLLMRFYEADSGRILVDGTDIASMTRADLRARIGLVSQDSWLFGGTIAENIAYGRPDATEEEIVAAARATCVDRFVRALPDGYQTVLDDDHSSLSVGERQLITVARALLAQPTILLLDEATATVDVRTEILIQRAMTSLRAGRTSFVIAHRLSTIRHADLIVVMEAGQIVEHGTHDSLSRAGGPYARLRASGMPLPATLAGPGGN